MIELNQALLEEYSLTLKKNKYKNIIQDFNLECCSDENGIFIKLLLIKIKKSQRLKGWGSAIINDICNLADSHNVRIRLFATDVYGSDLKRLHGFYRKQSFVLIKNGNINEMLYYPQKNIKLL